jgi:hypothetical protein
MVAVLNMVVSTPQIFGYGLADTACLETDGERMPLLGR